MVLWLVPCRWKLPPPQARPQIPIVVAVGKLVVAVIPVWHRLVQVADSMFKTVNGLLCRRVSTVSRAQVALVWWVRTVPDRLNIPVLRPPAVVPLTSLWAMAFFLLVRVASPLSLFNSSRRLPFVRLTRQAVLVGVRA